MKWSTLAYGRRGDTCIIMGNGPSLCEWLSRPSPRFVETFGSNGIYLGTTPDYYVCVDPVMRPYIKDAALPLLGASKVLFLGRELLKGGLLADISDPRIVKVETVQRPHFSIAPELGVYEGYTVTYVMLQIAYWLGFERAYLVGVDWHDMDQHFSIDYPKFGATYLKSNMSVAEDAFRMAKYEWENDGRSITNLTPGTALDVFKKADVEDIRW